MKRILSVMLGLVLMLSFSSCSLFSDDTEISLAENNVIINWIRFLNVTAQNLEAEKWASGYLADFCEDPCYDSYENALIALSVAGTQTDMIYNEALPVFSITDEEYALLAKNGSDIEVIKNHLMSAEADIKALAEDCFETTAAIMKYSFSDEGVRYLLSLSELMQKKTELYSQLLRIDTNHMLLLFGYKEYPAAVKQGATGIIDAGTEFSSDFSALGKSREAVSEELENTKAALRELGSTEKLLAENYVKSLPCSENTAPSWTEDKISVFVCDSEKIRLYAYYYSGKNGDEVLSYVKAGDSLASLNTDFSVGIENMTKDGFMGYVTSLVEEGCRYYTESGSFTDDSNMLCHVEKDGGVFSLYWENGKFSIYSDSENCIFYMKPCK